VIFAVIGKGGVGKTTVTALLLRRFLETNETPVLAIDADPSNCLGPGLGVNVRTTLADLRETLREGKGRPQSMSSGEWLALQAEDAMVENPGFDLLTMGRPEGRGCYCYVNNLIRDHLDRLARSYRHVVLDCEAGLEHLSRRTSGSPDALICVVGRSRMAAETVRRSLALYTELHGALPTRVDLVLNQFEEGEPLAASLSEIASDGGQYRFSRVLRLPRDARIADCEASGESLLALDGASAAVAALAAWEVRA
jgi:CO dehydrogenase maturation factor